jgi:hypothetical protein
MQQKNRMEATRQMKLETLKARIVSHDYVVDTDAVAEAIVRRLGGVFVAGQPALGAAGGEARARFAGDDFPHPNKL